MSKKNESLGKTVGVVLALCLVCSIVVSGAAIGLKPMQERNAALAMQENILNAAGIYEKGMDVQDQGYKHAPVELEDDVWLGSHVVILPNCIIRKGCVVGSNAVVTKSTDKGNVLAGIPARVIKERS